MNLSHDELGKRHPNCAPYRSKEASSLVHAVEKHAPCQRACTLNKIRSIRLSSASARNRAVPELNDQIPGSFHHGYPTELVLSHQPPRRLPPRPQTHWKHFPLIRLAWATSNPLHHHHHLPKLVDCPKFPAPVAQAEHSLPSPPTAHATEAEVL